MNKGGASGATELGNWSDSLEGPWMGLIGRAIEHSEQPYQSFFNATGRTRTPGINADQEEAMQYTREMSRMSSQPFGAMNGARAGIEDTLGGDYLNSSPGGIGANGYDRFNPWTHGDHPNRFTGNNNPWGQVEEPYNDVRISPAEGGASGGPQETYFGIPPPSGGMGDSYNNRFAGNQNPYSQQQINSGGTYQGSQLGSGGMFSAGPTDAGVNQFQGMENPYFQQTVRDAMQEAGDVYKNVTEPELRAQMVLNGTLGGGAHDQLRDRAQGNLAKQLGTISNQMYSGQYDRSAGLDESRLGRYFQGQQFDTGIGAQSFENAANRGMQAGQFNNSFGAQNYENAMNRSMQGQQFGMGLGSQNYENQLNRMTQAEEARLGRGFTGFQAAQDRGFQADESAINRGNAGWQAAADREFQGYQSERDRMMQGIGLGQNEQNLAFQRAASMMGIGDFQRGVTGQENDEMYQNWFDERNYNRNADAWLASILGTAQGGLPASQIQAPSSPWANALGTGLAAYGMFRS